MPMTPDRNIIARATALGWRSENLGDETDSGAALDWMCERMATLVSKLLLHEGGMRGDALKALNEQPGLKARVAELEALPRGSTGGAFRAKVCKLARVFEWDSDGEIREKEDLVTSSGLALTFIGCRVAELEADFKLLRSFAASDTMTRYTMAKRLNAEQRGEPVETEVKNG